MAKASRVTTMVLAGAVAAVMGFGAPSAEAAGIWVRDGNGSTVFNGGPGSVNLTINVNGSNTAVAAGAFALQYSFDRTGWTDFLTYCLEPDEALGISGLTARQGVFVDGIGSAPDYASSAGALTSLVNTWFGDSLTSATRSAAFQVALWELAFDDSVDLAGGDFRFTQGGTTPNAVRAQALAYLNAANWVSGGEPLDVILRVGNQDLIVQIPEPATIALFGIGLVGLAVTARRRRLG
jgi:hypothetical protein